MLKKSSRRNDRPRAANSRRYQWAVLIIVALSILGTTMLGQVTSRKKAESVSSQASVMSLSSTAPSKEYIYAGSKLVATEEPISFADVPPTNIFYNDILKIARRRVTVGCGGGNYCPNQTVTREQMAAFIMKALGEFDPPTPPSQRFTDVPPANVFYNFIDRLAVLQITLGCTADHTVYCRADSVPHEQMATFIVRALHPPGYTPPTPPSPLFTDVPPQNTFYAFIDEYATRGIWQGCTDGLPHPTFCPSEAVTRGQMAHILVQAFGANWQ